MLCFIRHAQTQGNISNVWVGRKDEPIASIGFKKLAEVAKELSLIKFDKIYSSPLQRTYKTALCIAEHQTIKPEIIIEPCLIERDFAQFEGVHKTQLARLMLESARQVESLESIKKRIQPVLLKLINDNKNNLIVSHSAVFRCLVNEFKLITNPSKKSLRNLEWVQIISM